MMESNHAKISVYYSNLHYYIYTLAQLISTFHTLKIPFLNLSHISIEEFLTTLRSLFCPISLAPFKLWTKIVAELINLSNIVSTFLALGTVKIKLDLVLSYKDIFYSHLHLGRIEGFLLTALCHVSYLNQ